ncbi:MAG: hypothetical protein IPP77_08065 [Bacteroidetes bacterium]|nr:hypothetical protein [Bacteroidota bacterium]
MKDRILNGWNLTRVIYVLMGLLLIIYSVMEQQWFGLVVGGYFAAMGIFSFGCAAGQCDVRSQRTDFHQKKSASSEAIDFVESTKD